jgi:hypothetical protein
LDRAAAWSWRGATIPYYRGGQDRYRSQNSFRAIKIHHGTSLTALHKLYSSRGYGLAAVSSAGGNAFFTMSGTLDPKEAWRPNSFREQFSGIPHGQQWSAVKDLPYVVV